MKEIEVAMVILEGPENEVLALKKSEGLRDTERYQKNPWETPGGKIEINETPEEAGLREVREETSLEANIIGQKGLITQTQTGKKIDFYPLALKTTEMEVLLSDEHEDYEWLEKTEFEKRLPEHNVQALKKVEGFV